MLNSYAVWASFFICHLFCSGGNFGPGGTATIAGFSCVSQSWGARAIVCRVPVGAGLNQPVYVTVGGQTNYEPDLFHYLPPTITSLTPVRFDSQGGAIMLIGGSSFSLSSVVRIGTFVCPHVQAQTHTAISCQLPAGQGANLTVTITTSAGQVGSCASCFSYNPPVISSISPSGGRSGENIYITLSGTSFGASGGVVRVGTGVCDTTSGVYQHQVINCAVPVGAGANLPVYIVVGNQTSNIVRFSFTPVITSVTVVAGVAYTSGGATLQLVGTGFNTPDVAVAAVLVGGRSCTVLTQADTLVTCTLPEGQGGTNAVTLTVGTPAQSSNSLNFAYANPVITSVQPPTGPTLGGTEITIDGFSFGMGAAASLSVTINSLPCVVNSSSGNLTRVLCTTPAGSGAKQPLILTAAGLASQTWEWSYDAPVITAITPVGGLTSGDYPVTLFGRHFGGASAPSVALVGGSLTTLSFRNESMAVVTIPPGNGLLGLQMLVNLQVSNIWNFVFDRPTLTGVSPLSFDAAGGRTLTLTGLSLGSSGVVYIGSTSVQCPLLSPPGWAQTSISCTLPPGQGQNISVFVLVGGQTSNSLLISYDAPLIYSASPALSPTSGQLLTISGYSFGTVGTVSAGGVPCDVTVAPTVFTSNRIVCQLRAGQGTNIAVSVTSSGRTSNSTLISYAPPTITSVSPTNGPTAGGHPITVSSHPHFPSSTAPLMRFGCV